MSRDVIHRWLHFVVLIGVALALWGIAAAHRLRLADDLASSGDRRCRLATEEGPDRPPSVPPTRGWAALRTMTSFVRGIPQFTLARGVTPVALRERPSAT